MQVKVRETRRVLPAALEAIGEHPEGDRLRSDDGSRLGAAIRKDARQFRDLGQPAAVRLALDVDGQGHGMRKPNPRAPMGHGKAAERDCRVSPWDLSRTAIRCITLCMATKDVIIPVRVTKADRDLLKRMAPGGSVSAWLRDLAIAAARKRRAIFDLKRLLDAAKAAGDMTDEEAAELAAEAKRELRSRRR